jgi:predicted nucleotide-binding protein
MPDAAQLPSLLTPVETSRVKLVTQIEKAKELQKAAGAHLSDRTFDDLWVQERKLREYNETLLRSMFNSDAVATKFTEDTKVFEWNSRSRRVDWENLREVEEQHGTDPHDSLRSRIAKQIRFLESLVERLDLHPVAVAGARTRTIADGSTKVFIVHGHDRAVKESTIRFVEKLGLTPVVLDESPNKGRTIIEKFEDLAADVVFAIVLFTPDDVGGKAARGTKLQRRARQNVVFELGFFVGRLGRDRVCLLHKADAEIPSDLHGVLYVPLDEHEGWHVGLAREMKAAELSFDLNRIL